MCDKCQKLEIDVQRYRQRLEQSLDPRAIEIQRTWKLLALGLDPLTIGRLDRVIHELVRPKRPYAPNVSRFPRGTTTGPSLRRGRKVAGLLERVIH
jgi:hypothetical protein